MLYDDNTTEDADAETIKEDVTINGERKIPGRQKVVRVSNVQVFNFARGSESTFVHCTQPLRLRLSASARLGYEREARVINV